MYKRQDALRLYLLNSAALKAEEMRMTEDGIKESLRSVIIPVWYAYSFFVTYANIDNWSPDQVQKTATAHRLDRWILSELQTLIHNINTEMEAYRLYRTVPAMVAMPTVIRQNSSLSVIRLTYGRISSGDSLMPRKSRLSRSQHYSSNGSSETFPALSRRLARMPIMAITTRSSMSVKPLSLCPWIFKSNILPMSEEPC